MCLALLFTSGCHVEPDEEPGNVTTCAWRYYLPPTDAEIEGLQVPDENRPHIFWDCPIVNQCVQEVYHNLWGGNGQVDKKSFLMGKDMGIVEATMLHMLSNMCIKYRLWKYKLAGVLPKVNCIKNDVIKWMDELTWYHKWRIMLPLVRRQIYV